MPTSSRIARSLPAVSLLAVAYIPLLFTAPGVVAADTKAYLYLDPSRLMSRAWSMWDPSVGAGTVTHQNIGSLWPMGPWYWTFDRLGVPDWVAQRLWLGTILALAGFGVAWLLRTLGWRGPEPWAAAFMYALTPYLLSAAGRMSVLLLPFAAMPWLIGIVGRSLRERGWRWPAIFALVVTTVGSVDPTALVLVAVASALWVGWAVAAKEVTLGRAARAVGRMGLLTIPISLWWLSGLWVERGWGLDVHRYRETANVVAQTSTATEVLRGLGDWSFYGGDKLGPWIEPSDWYTTRLAVIALSFAIPIGALTAIGFTRWRHRGFFVALLAVGVVLAVGAYPWDDPTLFGRGVQELPQSGVGLTMRSLPRAVPLIALAMATFGAGGVVALGRRFAQVRWPAVAAVMVIALMNMPALWLGKMVPPNLRRDEDIPSYWDEAAAALDARGSGTRVLEIPGSDFASHRWGSTVDPVLAGLMDRPTLARERMPSGTGPSAALLIALDRRLQEGTLDPQALAVIARLLNAGDVVVRSDLQYERYNTPRPSNLWSLVTGAPGLGEPATFGEPAPNDAVPQATLFDELFLQTDSLLPDPPPVAAFPVEDVLPIVRAQSASAPLVVAGDGEGLVDAAELGLIDGHELIFYSAATGGAIPPDATLLVTDTNRRQGRRWTSVRHNTADTGEAGTSPLRSDLSVNDLPVFPGDAGDDTRTVAIHRGGVHAQATSFGNPTTFTPEARAANAVDGDPTTAWRAGASDDAVGNRLRLTFDDPVTTDRITLLQPTTGENNRVLTKVRLHFDAGPSVDVDLDQASVQSSGQSVHFTERTFSSLDIELRADSAGSPSRFAGFTSVGFAEVTVDDLRVHEVIRLPTDLETANEHPLTFLLSRQRSLPSDATRADEELALIRALALSDTRSFVVGGRARLSAHASDGTLDDLVGTTLPGIPADVRSTTSIRLNGDRTARGSSTIDGDPSTAWTTAFGTSVGEWVEYQVANPATIDRLELAVVADGWHSVPTSVLLTADGRDLGTLALPDISDDPDRRLGTTATVTLPIPPTTASTVRLTIAGVREVETINWNSGEPIAMPVALAEVQFGPTPITLPRPFDFIDSGCRDDLLTVDGRPVAVRITGATMPALRGDSLAVEACDGPITLDSGEHVIEATQGRRSGLDLDQLVLRSAAGGGPSFDTGVLVTTEPASGSVPRVAVTGDKRWQISADVTGARPGQPFWLTLGQGFSDGWRMSIDGDAEAASNQPRLVGGYANGWLITPAANTFSVTLTFEPQRVVNLALLLSGAAAVVCIALVLWPRRAAAPSPAFLAPPAPTDLEPAPFSRAQWLTYDDLAPPRWPWSLLLTLTVGLAFAAVAGPIVGGAVAVAALVASRWRNGRWLLTLGSPAALAIAAAYVLSAQARHHIAPGIEWPHELRRAHPFGWLAVGLLVAEALVSRLWVRRDTPRRRRPAHARRRRRRR